MEEDNNEESKEQSPARAWFDWYIERLEGNSIYAEEMDGIMYRCPCCDYQTLGSRGSYEICPVCFWEDDGQDDHDAHIIRGGPNASLSLTAARKNYQKFGACDERSLKHVRLPKPNEM